MNAIFERLTNRLLETNDYLSYHQARTWVEVLWEDFETTRAKGGWSYRGHEMTERIVLEWINRYGPTLHEFVTENPKYKHLLENNNGLQQ